MKKRNVFATMAAWMFTVSMLLGVTAMAQLTFNDIGTGTWSTGDGTVWNQAAAVPGATDTVVIDSHTVTADLPDPILVANLTVGKSHYVTAGTLTVNQNMTVAGQLTLLGNDSYKITGDGVHKITTADLRWDGGGSSTYGASINAGAIIEASGVNSRLGPGMDRTPRLEGAIRILSGGTFAYESSQSLSSLTGTGTFTVDSGAAFRKTGAGSNTQFTPTFTNNGSVSLSANTNTLTLTREQSDSGDWDISAGSTLALFYTGASVAHTGSFTGAGNLQLKANTGYDLPAKTKTIGAPGETFNLTGTTTIPSESGQNSAYVFASSPLTFGNLTFGNYSRGNVVLPAGTHTILGNLNLGYTGINGAGVASTTLNVLGNMTLANCWMSDGRTFQNMTLNISGAGSYSSYLDRNNTFNCPVNLLDGAVFDHRWEYGGYGTGLINGGGTWTVNAGAALVKTTYALTNPGAVVPGQYASRLLNPVVNAGGLVRVDFGTLALEGGFTQTGGTVDLNGGRLNLSGSPQFTGGMIAGGGTLGASVNATGAGSGLTISPGHSVGHITITGATTLDANDTIAIELGGLTPGVDSDLLTVNNTLTLGGATIHGSLLGTFAPLDTDSITVIQATAVAGTPGGTSTPAHIIPPGTPLADYQATYGIALADFTATVTAGTSVVLSAFDLYPYVDIVLNSLGGGLYGLDASGSYDPDDSVPGILSFAWDATGDGNFTDSLVATLTLGGPGYYTVGIQVVDNDSTMTQLVGLNFAIPEPSSLLLAVLGLGALAVRRGSGNRET